MIELINSFGFSYSDWLIAMISGLLIGIAKAGLSGTGIMVIPVMAIVFGGKASVGIILPMLIIADIFAVKYYNRSADWSYIVKLLPWAAVGIIIAMLVGNYVSDELFKRVLAITILCGVVLMTWQELTRERKVPKNKWFARSLGLAGGFATMIGNAAGPILSLYLLAMKIPKVVFIGSGAWFYLLVNLFKVPLHIFIWKTITLKTLVFDLIMVPAIIAGVFIGIQIVKVIPEKPYRILVIGTITVSSLMLF